MKLLWIILAALAVFPAGAQTFPSKPVRLVVVYPPGGTSDAVTRLLAEKLALALPDVVERLTRLDNVVASSTPEQFGQVIRREYEANAKIVAKAGIRSE